ncbi:MAG: polysaccharide pyruvyl transferase family protein [Bacillota bacterium]
MKILLYGVMTEDNFGGPSLIHGVRQLIRKLDEDADIICYQPTKIKEIAVSDMDIPVYQMPYKGARLLLDGLKYKFGIRPKNERCLMFLDHIKTADIVADLFGICFCEHFFPKKIGRFKAIKSVIGKFSVSFLARLYKRKTVKCPASYGPILSKGLKIQARYAAKHIFDIMYARENESKTQMQNAGVRNVLTSPDLANMMPYDTPVNRQFIGISVSYQIINQWRSDETYIECMDKLIRYILETTDLSVELIPNEIVETNDYNDIHVANDIHERFDHSERVAIADVKNMSSTQIKSLIAGSEAFIGSRYHACVASLSSGVPTLIVGWHYKYDELLHWYGQDQWIISNNNCSSERLIEMFKSFWDNHNNEREVIKAKLPQVWDALLESGKVMFSK